MLDFLRSRFVPQKKRRQSREQARPGVQLLASVLVCFPEIQAVAYEPAQGSLTIDFTVRAALPADEIDAFTVFLAESIETYHAIEDGISCDVHSSYEQHGTLTMLRLMRRMNEVTEGELSLIVRLMHGKFAEQLIVDPHNMDTLDAEFSSIQHETLERMLTAVREMPLHDCLVGIRERDQVIVYNR
ncbi:hypothetical protein [Selenomonas sp. F0473]|uniref:hypothetical protein n=1 Tax=Selenomonas sp. F0473 TaxID=999423 RepID=UPI00029E7985|nr:hypothetical protein [Selenomonas sp. F0473]EKU70694.1 hypothetical protein HMPREF9161_01740 [Selenomonas sp. F0473]